MTINTTDLTTIDLEGTGVFDVLMQTATLHLKGEFEAGRIRGNDYATVYTGMLGAAMQASISYSVQKPTADEQALKVVQDRLLVEEQIKSENANTSDTNIGTDSMLYAQRALVVAQESYQTAAEALVAEKEQTEAAQSSNAPTSGSVLARQTDLYIEQGKGYKADRAVKAATLYTNTLAANMSVNDGIVVPTGLDSGAINTAMGKVVSTTT
jgi:hypothetical protein